VRDPPEGPDDHPEGDDDEGGHDDDHGRHDDHEQVAVARDSRAAEWRRPVRGSTGVQRGDRKGA
jgi:hypothetical protein